MSTIAPALPQPQVSTTEVGRLAWRLFILQQINLFTSLPCAIYIVLLIAQISPEQAAVALMPIPVFALVCGIITPLGLVWWLTHRAFAVNPGEAPGVRLVRLLKLPQQLEAWILSAYNLGNASYLLWLAVRLDKPLYIVPWGASVILVMMMLVMTWTRVFVQRQLMPHAVEEFMRAPQAPLRGTRGVLWPRQSWYLPYCFGLFVTCTVLSLSSIVVRMGMDLYARVMALLPVGLIASMQAAIFSALEQASVPLALVSLYMLVTSACAAWLLTRHQEQGTLAVRDSIEGFANGAPRMPAWVTTDETGDLARATARAYHQLRDFALSLDGTASKLGSSAAQLNHANQEQNEAIARQAAALQQAQETAREIQETSRVTAQKAENILKQTARFQELGAQGEATLQHSIEGLQAIHTQVGGMAGSIRQLSERARQIDSIARVVKDLTTRSNMLALNAAIESVRSGEHGKGFGVVAREIRLMADQSSKAASEVRDMLTSLTEAIRDTVELTERGSEAVSASVEQVRATGDSLRSLTTLVQDSVNSVRQISATVGQQDTGVSQIFDAIKDLSGIMVDTLTQVREMDEVSRNVSEVATDVNVLITRHGWERDPVR
ncbi:MAG: methyl-accepting chemotaxis protein [Cystobacter sp.]